MIAQLRGHILHQDRSGVVLDVQGVGYAVQTSGRTGSMLGHDGGEVVLLTEMQVREDSMTLFGFVDVAERDAFRLLITVQGVGAKAAMSILSVLSPDELTHAIVVKDKALVARADGVGPKIAQRVVNELAEKIGSIASLGGALTIGATPAAAGTDDPGGAGGAGPVDDAVSALVNLGYGRAEAHMAVLRVQKTGVADDLPALIATALREMGG